MNALWVEFDHVRPDMQYTSAAKNWVVRTNGKEMLIKVVKDYGPVLHGKQDDGTEVCFSPACVVRHE